MISLSMGGKSNLAPIKSIQRHKTNGKPNWIVFERVYGTVKILNICIAFISVGIAILVGYFALNNIINNYELKVSIWFAFGFLQITTLTMMIFQHYQIALIGMNYVTLCNRWNILFSILSVFFGCIVVILTESILGLIFVSQLFILFPILIFFYLIKKVEGGRINKMKYFCFDNDVFRWAREPVLKGFITQFSNIGVLQYGSIMITKLGDSVIISSYLFTMYLVQVVVQCSSVPLTSISPLLGKLLSSNRLYELNKIYLKRVFYSIILMSLGFSFLIIFESFFHKFNTKTNLLPALPLLLLCSLALLQNTVNNAASICGVGNYIVMFWTAILSSLISIFMLSNIHPNTSFYFIIASIFAPRLVLYNIRTQSELVRLFLALVLVIT